MKKIVKNFIPLKISINKLITHRIDHDIYNPVYNDINITLNEIREYIIKNGVITIDAHFERKLLWDKENHIRRIIYFIKTPEDISDIYIQCKKHSCWIEDGNHRFMAACYLKLPFIYGWCVGYNSLMRKLIYNNK